MKNLYQNILLEWVVMQLEFEEMKNHAGMYIRSRLRIIGLKWFPPQNGGSHRLESDFEAMCTMDRTERRAYDKWLTDLRETYYKKEREQDFTPEFKKRLETIAALRN